MITHLASPAVCVIDDEPEDYTPILNALLRLGIGCVHVRGNDSFNLPPVPFTGLRLVFMDLHLNGGSPGKTTASHAVRVFGSVVKPDSLPVVVVIWSKYADKKASEIEGLPVEDLADNIEFPEEDQPRDADLFKNILFEFYPDMEERLVFVEIPKPFGKDRPEDEAWTEELKRHIENSLQHLDAFDVLWKWEALVRETVSSFNGEIARIASTKEKRTLQEKDEDLKLLLKTLVHEQGGPDSTATTAHRHLALALGQSLTDHIEHANGLSDLEKHGAWLSEIEGVKEAKKVIGPQLNSLLLTSSCSAQSASFIPGTVFQVTDMDEFKKIFAAKAENLVAGSYSEIKKGWTLDEWKNNVKHVFIELTPSCDFHQDNRCQVLLMGGLLIPAAGRGNVKKADYIQTLPTFTLRWPTDDFAEQDAFLMFCSRYRVTMPSAAEPAWLFPWFRLRELPTASLRNWQAGHSSRVGYVSF